MPILARYKTFQDFFDFQEALETAMLRMSKIPTVGFDVQSFLVICSEVLFSSDTNLPNGKLDLGQKLKDFSTTGICTSKHMQNLLFP